MNAASIWKTNSPEVTFPRLERDIEVEIVIIGGGITGISAAQLLTSEGKRVVVLEAARVGLGTTGYSTGNLHATVDEKLHSIEQKWDRPSAAQVVKARTAMIDFIERTISEFQIDCGFVRRPHYLFALDTSQADQLTDELKALQNSGLHAEVAPDLALSFPVNRVVRIDGQAQFNPLAYVRSLAKAIESDRCMIFEESQAIDINEKALMVSTAHGTVRAAAIIMATHTPKGFNLLQTELGPYREYGIAARLKEDYYPDGLFWSLEEPSHSIRSYDAAGKKYLVVIGEEHKVGQQDSRVDYFQNVEDFARAHFNVDAVTHRWSAQNYKPADGLPYIGRSIGSDQIYVATGFATNGLLYGVLGGSIIADIVLRKKNPWQDLFNPRRFTPAKSTIKFMAENFNVANEYFRDY
jgi:glycine/D-amino acid oxidase-like deaminating enzyme